MQQAHCPPAHEQGNLNPGSDGGRVVTACGAETTGLVEFFFEVPFRFNALASERILYFQIDETKVFLY